MMNKKKIKQIFKKLRKDMNNGETDYIVSIKEMDKAEEEVLNEIRNLR